MVFVEVLSLTGVCLVIHICSIKYLYNSIYSNYEDYTFIASNYDDYDDAPLTPPTNLTPPPSPSSPCSVTSETFLLAPSPHTSDEQKLWIRL